MAGYMASEEKVAVTVETATQSSELRSMIEQVTESLNKPSRLAINNEFIQKIAESALTSDLNINDVKEIFANFPPNGLTPNDYIDFVKSCNDKFVKQKNLNEQLDGSPDKAAIIKYFNEDRICQPKLETVINAMAKQRYEQQQMPNKPLQNVENAIKNYNEEALNFSVQLIKAYREEFGYDKEFSHDLVTAGVNYFMNARGVEHKDRTPESIAAGFNLLIRDLYEGDELVRAKDQAKYDPEMVLTLIEGAKYTRAEVVKAESAVRADVGSEPGQTTGSGFTAR